MERRLKTSEIKPKKKKKKRTRKPRDCEPLNLVLDVESNKIREVKNDPPKPYNPNKFFNKAFAEKTQKLQSQIESLLTE